MTSDGTDDTIDPRIFHNKTFRLYKSNTAIARTFTNQQIQYLRLNIAKYVYKGVSDLAAEGSVSASDFLRGVSVKHVSKKLDVVDEVTGDTTIDNTLYVSYLTVKQPDVGLRSLLVFVTRDESDSRSVILMKNGMRQGLIAARDFDAFIVTLLQSMPSSLQDTDDAPLAIRALALSSEYLKEVTNNVLTMFQKRSQLSKLQALDLVFSRDHLRLKINDHLQNISVSVPSSDLEVLLRETSELLPIDTVLEFVAKSSTLNLARLELVRLVTGPLSLSGDGGVRVSTTHALLLPYVLSTLYSEL